MARYRVIVTAVSRSSGSAAHEGDIIEIEDRASVSKLKRLGAVEEVEQPKPKVSRDKEQDSGGDVRDADSGARRSQSGRKSRGNGS